MQDRYAGDIGDYGKLGLLRALRSRGLSIGVNWYKTAPIEQEYRPDGTFRQNDGKHLIPPAYMHCDPELSAALLSVSKARTRAIRALEEACLIPDAKYYSEELRLAERAEWHRRALEALSGAGLILLDPDNGLLVKSVGKNSKKSVKYVFYEELSDYLRRGQSAMVYNHRARKKPDLYFGEIRSRLSEFDALRDRRLLIVTFPKYSVRDYFILCANDAHYAVIQTLLMDYIESSWGQTGFCRLQQ